MLVRRLTFLLIISIIIIGSIYYFRHTKSNFSQNNTYRVNRTEIKNLLKLSEEPTINFVSTGMNSKSARFDWPLQPGTELISTWFNLREDKLVLDFYLDENYEQILLERPSDAIRMINHAIILGYIASQLDASKYTISSFCDNNCDITQFHTVETLK